MPRRPTEQTPLLDDSPRTIVGVDVVERRGDPTTACSKMADQAQAQAQMVPGVDQVERGKCGHGADGDGDGGGAGAVSSVRKKMTPIPWRQLLTLCLVRLIDPICFSQIFPYINDMLLGMGVVGPNEPERVGFYSGLIESTFSVAVALAIYPWARLSGASSLY